MLGGGQHKIESKEQFRNSPDVCTSIGLDGLVVVAGTIRTQMTPSWRRISKPTAATPMS